MLSLTPLVVAYSTLVAAPAPLPEKPREEPAASTQVRTRRSRLPPALRAYLTRPVPISARHLDHGILHVAAAGGFPHLYRLELGIGLLDHLSLGVTAHWLPDQAQPRFAPRVALAFYRWPRFEIGLLHLWSLYPPPKTDDDRETPSFQESAQWFLATASFSHGWVSGGADAGVVRAREIDPGQLSNADGTNPSHIRYRPGGGIHLRAGARRWGFTANVLAPHLYAELVFDLRFGLFEARPRGGWRPQGVVWSTDRRVPTWR